MGLAGHHRRGGEKGGLLLQVGVGCGASLPLGLGLTVRYSAVGVGVNSALQCCWGWGYRYVIERASGAREAFNRTHALEVVASGRAQQGLGVSIRLNLTPIYPQFNPNLTPS